MCSRVYASIWLLLVTIYWRLKKTRVNLRSRGELNFYFLVLSVINLIQRPNTKVKLIRIVIFSPLAIDGWYINDWGYQPHQLSQIKLGIVYHIYKVYPFRTITDVWPRYNGRGQKISHLYPYKIKRNYERKAVSIMGFVSTQINDSNASFWH